MLKYGNRDFRNLQEQVYANMRNIEDIIKGSDVMADYTLNIVGQVDEAAELPDADTYEGKLGDIYVVGESSPFHCYVFAKVYEYENAPSWVDLGAIFVQGPQGEQGIQGPAGQDGADGQDGAAGGFGTPTASATGLETGSDPTVSVSASGPDTAKIFAFSFGIPAGAKGEDGSSATITVGSTTTGAAGTNASVTNSGTSSAAVLNFTIPRGDTGLGVPEIQEGDAGKVLLVNAGETAAEWGTDNSLKLPESAPAAQQLVGINTSGEQNALGIGDGLAVSNGELQAVELFTIRIDAASTASSKTFTLTTDQISYIATNKPVIKVVFNDNITTLCTFANSNANFQMYKGFSEALSGSGNCDVLLNSQGATNYAYKQVRVEVDIPLTVGATSVTAYMNSLFLNRDKPEAIVPSSAAVGFSLTDGGTISNAIAKSLINAGSCLRINNNNYAYPMYNTSSFAYYYNSSLDGSDNIVETIYKINKST